MPQYYGTYTNYEITDKMKEDMARTYGKYLHDNNIKNYDLNKDYAATVITPNGNYLLGYAPNTQNNSSSQSFYSGGGGGGGGTVANTNLPKTITTNTKTSPNFDANVARLQQQLQLAGQNWLPVTGVIDDNTRKALNNLNKQIGVGNTSAATQKTLDYLSKYNPSSGSSSTKATQKTLDYLSKYNPSSGSSSTKATQSTVPQTTLDFQQAIQNTLNQYQPPQMPDFSAIYTQQQAQLNDMFAQQQAATLAKLQAIRNKAIAGYNTQKNDAETAYQNTVNALNNQKAEGFNRYYQLKNQTDAQSVLAAQKLREQMANMGLVNSGDNVQANLGLQNTRLNALNDVNMQEQQFNNDIATQMNNAALEKQNQLNKINQAIQDLINNGAAEDSAAVQELAAEKMRMELELMQDKAANMWRQYEAGYNRTQDALKNALTGITTQYQMFNDKFNQDMEKKKLDWMLNPNNPDNILKQLDIERARIENKYLPQQLQLDLLNRRSIINNRSGGSSGRSSSVSYSGYAKSPQYANTVYKNPDEKVIYNIAMSNKPLNERLTALNNVRNASNLPQSTRDYANSMWQAILQGARYDAAFKNYLKKK